MAANTDKFQFIIMGNKGSHILQIGDITTKPERFSFNPQSTILLVKRFPEEGVMQRKYFSKDMTIRAIPKISTKNLM